MIFIHSSSRPTHRFLFLILMAAASFFQVTSQSARAQESEAEVKPAEEAKEKPEVKPQGNLSDLTPSTFADIAEKTLPSVVAVYVKSSLQDQMRQMREKLDPSHKQFFDDPRFKKFFDETPGEEGGPGEEAPPEDDEIKTSGSGVIISSDGYIVTNLHIVQGAKEGTISVVLHDDTEIPSDKVQVVATDDLIDLAVLKVDAAGHSLPPIPWGDSDAIRIGEWVVAIGNPLDLRGTVSTGIISAKSRKIEKVPIEHLLQTDAMINPGNSGGALVNLNGELVGINMAIATNSGFFQGIGFAIPAKDAQFATDQVIKHGRIRRGYIGIHMSQVEENVTKALGFDDSVKEGIIVTEVMPGAPADKAGVHAYDIITLVDAVQIRETSDLLGVIAGKAVGDKAKLTIMRNVAGKTKELSLAMEVTERPGSDEISKQQQDLQIMKERKPEVKNDPLSLIGLTLQPFTLNSISGLEVTAVRARSMAAVAEMRVGDVVLEINRVPVGTMDDTTKALAERKEGEPHLFRFLQDGRYVVKAIKPIEKVQ